MSSMSSMSPAGGSAGRPSTARPAAARLQVPPLTNPGASPTPAPVAPASFQRIAGSTATNGCSHDMGTVGPLTSDRPRATRPARAASKPRPSAAVATRPVGSPGSNRVSDTAAEARERLGRLAGAGVLDRPRPLPEHFRPLARLLSPSRTVTWTSGSRTRAALKEARASAAATGSVVHLPRPPGTNPTDLGVLAHELTHVGDRRRRHAHADLFSLSSVGSALDAGERRARQVGSAVTAATRMSERVPGGTADLPVGGAPAGMGRVMDIARGAATKALTAAQGNSPVSPTSGSQIENAVGQGAQTVGDAVPAIPRIRDAARVTPSVVGDTASALLQTASVAGDRDSQVGELLEALEERVLLEMERRGGRWGGVF